MTAVATKTDGRIIFKPEIQRGGGLQVSTLPKAPNRSDQVWEIKTGNDVKKVLSRLVRNFGQELVAYKFDQACPTDSTDGLPMIRMKIQDRKLVFHGSNVTQTKRKDGSWSDEGSSPIWQEPSKEYLQDYHLYVGNDKHLCLSRQESTIEPTMVNAGDIIPNRKK